MANSLTYQSDDTRPTVLSSLMRALSFCPHANAGWPIRCAGETVSSQHCYDCGAQRTYELQPFMQRGPWKHLQLGNGYPLEISVPLKANTEPSAHRSLAIS